MKSFRWNRIPKSIESAILELAHECPALGRFRAAIELNRRGFDVTQSTVRSVWARFGLQTSAKRHAAAAAATATTATHQVLTPSIEAQTRPFTFDPASEGFIFSLAAFAALSVDVAAAHDLDSSHAYSLLDGCFSSVPAQELDAPTACLPEGYAEQDQSGAASMTDFMLL